MLNSLINSKLELAITSDVTLMNVLVIEY